MIKARRLKPGDTVAAVSLSWGGPGAIPHRYEAGKRQLEEIFGLKVVETRHALADPDWIAANPAARTDDLMGAFADPSVDGIISTIGGEDSIRILPFIDGDVIRSNPKVFLGYSDTTVTHLACFKAGLVTFYGTSLMTGFAENGGILPYTVETMRRMIFSAEPPGAVPPNRDGWTVERLEWTKPELQSQRRRMNPCEGWRFVQGEGATEGRLIGGCVEVLDWLRGTDVWPGIDEWKEAILFIETSEEAPSPTYVARFLRSLAAAGVLERLGGILFGRPGGHAARVDPTEYDDAILGVVRDEQGRDDLPIVTNMDFGHTDPTWILPYGVRARIDTQEERVEILESGVV